MSSAVDNWAKRLESSSLNVIPSDFTLSTEGKVVSSSFVTEIPNTVKQALSSLAKSANVSEFDVFAALFLSLVYRYTGDEDIVAGSQTEDGTHIVLRAPVTGTTTFADLVKSVTEAKEFATANVASHSEIQDKTGELFRTLVLPRSAHGYPVLKDLALIVDADNVELSFNSLLYKQQRIDFVAQQIFQLIVGVAASPSEPLAKISLITPQQANVIPDPTANLDWCNYRGAIQDIFACNAAKHPDRPCVTETANILEPEHKTRTFTYKQIDEASNIVAHGLISSGIVVDDVVMIYAYRGVDLVITIMGVLKAGATFSVIDPAYPPARQNVYLSVAKPRGLIVLKKAGILAPLVKEYIADNLQLKAQITGLDLQDDGSVNTDDDVLKPFESSKDKQTGVVVGPDCHPTLSFTSGSEGIPKGVRGRHFSLAYYFPWMAETFNLSENDKFTMLSGIAHDPIQRDIFTPLFLGAQLLVPCADDIGTPGRLAEWMAENGASVTHLTPAMGQLLSAQASAAIPSLHHAFFVGDILTKRDCVKLQALAHNVNIINMYGTTETQRAVSYFEVPSVSKDSVFLQTQKDVIPAGKGMLNVEMLVVNRNDRSQVCGVGEVGEIYVRAGGLSDGYLGLPDMTAQKFLTSWFVEEGHWNDTAPSDAPWRKHWKGPRDRLYRTGDLGRYLPDGNTECSGRADDQVKIRGFRIELGEINTHLSRHPAVRENVTLVRRDKDEEPILIAYVVPETDKDDMLSAHESLDEEDGADHVVKGLVQYRRLIKDIRNYLKTKLPSYAIPSMIVPLSQMPLNPNGKIDKPRLPFPDTAQLDLVARHVKPAATEVDALTATEVQVRDLWVSILPRKPPQVESTDSFFDLGGHSILATKMIFEARSKLGVPELPLGAIFAHPTVAEFAKAVDGLRSSTVLTEAPSSSAKEGKKEVSYGEDANQLASKLPEYISPTLPLSPHQKLTVFLTGATGFLGSFIVRDLLERSQNIQILAHVRAKDAESGLARIKNTGLAYNVWKDEYASKIEVVIGNLEHDRFGLPEDQWASLCNRVDVIIHNGALVHWVYPYSTLRGPNVIGTINVMSLCASGRPKYFSFVSSTSSIDTDHYVELSDRLVEQGLAGIPESDDLEGSRNGLGSGYGQSKWAAEHIIRVAGAKHGLRGAIVRPGYVLGDSTTGVSNTDDFLLRMVKGSQQIGEYPNIANSVNMVPVDHVARLTVAAALHAPESSGISVVHVTSHPRIQFTEFLGCLASYGYDVSPAEYLPWRVALEKYVVEHGDSALFPLLHFVLDDLPQSTKAPHLDDSNAVKCLKSDAEWTGSDRSAGAGVDEKQLGVYFSFLVACGFMEPPSKPGLLPEPQISKEALAHFANAGGRSL